MNTRLSHAIVLYVAVTAILSLSLSSCGSKKAAVSSPRPQGVPEITLDQLVGGGSYVVSPAPAMSYDAKALVETAHRWLGTPYKYGGETREGVDCSALVMNVYKEALGMKLPRTSVTQHDNSQAVSKGNLTVGDLVFFSTTKGRTGISHVGLYIGNDRFIHASSSRGVVVSRLSDKYFVDHYHSAGRYLASRGIDQSAGEMVSQNTVRLEDLMEQNLDLLDEILTATIDSIYSIPVDDDPNLAPGL